jgi:hypothetical protein
MLFFVPPGARNFYGSAAQAGNIGAMLRLLPAVIFGLLSAAAVPACTSEPGPDQAPDGSSGPAVRTARISFLEGSVLIKRPADLDWQQAREGLELGIDDKIRTLRDSFTTLEFEQGGSLRIGPESLVKVTDLRLEPRNQARRSTFTVEEGRVEAELDSLQQAGSEFKIKTPSAEASVIHREVSFQ